MRKIRSLQRNILFIFCPYPITIDKRDEWGYDPRNVQQAPHGAFLKISSNNTVCHLVHANSDGTAPIGWEKGNVYGTFNKSPIWVEEELLEPDTKKKVRTLNGLVTYSVLTTSVLCYNDKNGEPDFKDGWVMPLYQIKKDYLF